MLGAALAALGVSRRCRAILGFILLIPHGCATFASRLALNRNTTIGNLARQLLELCFRAFRAIVAEFSGDLDL